MVTEINYEEFTKVLKSKKITPNQLYICMMISKKLYVPLAEYIEEVGPFNITEIEQLIEKGFILSTNEGVYQMENLIIMPIFEDFIETEEFFRELYDLYPSFMDINGKLVPTKSVSFDEISLRYLKQIQFNKKEHEKVIKATRITKSKNQYAPCKIDNFVYKKIWEAYYEFLDHNEAEGEI